MKTVLLSFDIEEFDIPLEYNKLLPLEEQIEISANGASLILDILERFDIRATFFSTVVFATHAREIISRIVADRHELASHNYYHSRHEPKHFSASKTELENLSGQVIEGFRMPRMMPVDERALAEAGYRYSSSVNPTFIPGRYNHFFSNRALHAKESIIELPASVTPSIRFPLFWLSFHNFPLWMYKAACLRAIKADGYLNIYFHPWEFIDLHDPRFGLPTFMARNSGGEMINRFSEWVTWLKSKGFTFSTIRDFLRDTDRSKLVPGI